MPSRGVVIAGSVLIAGLALSLAFWLGAWAFEVRRWSIHDARLHRLVQQQPSIDRVTRGLEDEGSRLVAAPAAEAELRRAVAERGRDRGPAILEKARRYPRIRVHLAADMVYFLFFDAEGVLRDYVLVSA